MSHSLTCADLLARYRRGEDVGEPMTFGAALEQTSNGGGDSATDLLTVPTDKVFLMTHVVCQADDLSGLIGDPAGNGIGGQNGSPIPAANYAAGVDLGPQGSSTDTIGFLAFRRWSNIFEPQGTPSWRTAAPSNAVSWKPKYPIPVPPTWQVKTGTTSGGTVGFGNLAACYGFLMSREQAIALGFRANKSQATGTQQSGVVSAIGTTSLTSLLAARPGYGIRIKDINIRMQPKTNTLSSVTLSQSTGTRAFLLVSNANPGDLIEHSFSPDIYLTAGAALQIQTTTTGICSVVVSYEYVLAQEIPDDHWWLSGSPAQPSPGTALGGPLGVNINYTSAALTPYFPGRNSASVTLQKGHQLMLNGYYINGQKSGTANQDKMAFTLSGGPTAGRVQIAIGAQTNVQLGPVFLLGMRNMNMSVVVDDVCIPIKNNPTGTPGGVFVDSANVSYGGLLASPSGTMLTSWNIAAWGSLAVEKVKHLANRGQ